MVGSSHSPNRDKGNPVPAFVIDSGRYKRALWQDRYTSLKSTRRQEKALIPKVHFNKTFPTKVEMVMESSEYIYILHIIRFRQIVTQLI